MQSFNWLFPVYLAPTLADFSLLKKSLAGLLGRQVGVFTNAQINELELVQEIFEGASVGRTTDMQVEVNK